MKQKLFYFILITGKVVNFLNALIKTFLPNISPRIHPAAHISTLVVWVLACRSSSGALYHKVTTFGDMGRTGKPNHLAKPKSAKKNCWIIL